MYMYQLIITFEVILLLINCIESAFIRVFRHRIYMYICYAPLLLSMYPS